MNIIERALQKSDTAHVVGKPGTGKTTSIINFIKDHPFNTFLLIFYNKENRTLNKKKVPGNTDVHTFHSLAFNNFAAMYDKDKIGGELNVYSVLKTLPYFKNTKIENQEKLSEAALTLDVLNKFLTSKDTKISHENKKIEDLAKEYFYLMIDPETNIKMPHDVYLKAFALTNPTLNYDYIIVDEAQDINGLMNSIITNQKKSKKIWVGDPDQAIYSYKGTINVFHNKSVNALTKTHRFGKDIADVANKFINIFKKDTFDIIPKKSVTSKIVNNFDYNSDFFTIIARTNAYIFEKAAELSDKSTPFHILGGTESIFKEILDVFHIYSGDYSSIKSPLLKSFRSFSEIKDFGEKTKDPEITYMCKIIEKYGNEVPFLVKKIYHKSTSLSKSRIVLTTAHKSKGLEFFNVKIADDFFPFFDKEGKLNPSYPEEEVNIYYVAITRAIDALALNQEINLLIRNHSSK